MTEVHELLKQASFVNFIRVINIHCVINLYSNITTFL